MTEKIMFVDDDPSILDAAKTAIESYGYEVITASSGEECLDKVGDADLVFLDIKMPGMNGIEVLKKIKERYPSLPVIMITAYATVDTAIEAMKLGAFDYVRKPFAIEELEGSILAALEEIKFEKLKKLNFKVENHMERFKELLKEGKGICITREPEIVKGMGNVRVVNMMNEWEPKDMERIKEEIENYVEEGIPILMTDVE
ncbi:MAG: response regulator [Thermoplasmata archaeon]|nr:MAG: response regulator [Thermoplasmata archaeon]